MNMFHTISIVGSSLRQIFTSVRFVHDESKICSSWYCACKRLKSERNSVLGNVFDVDSWIEMLEGVIIAVADTGRTIDEPTGKSTARWSSKRESYSIETNETVSAKCPLHPILLDIWQVDRKRIHLKVNGNGPSVVENLFVDHQNEIFVDDRSSSIYLQFAYVHLQEVQ